VKGNNIIKNNKDSFELNDNICTYAATFGYAIVLFSLFCAYIIMIKFSYSVDDLALSIFSLVVFFTGYRLSKSKGSIEFTQRNIKIYRKIPFGSKQETLNIRYYQYIKVDRSNSGSGSANPDAGPSRAYYEIHLSKSKKNKCEDDLDLGRYWTSERKEDVSIFLSSLINITDYAVVFDESYDGEFEELRKSLQ